MRLEPAMRILAKNQSI